MPDSAQHLSTHLTFSHYRVTSSSLLKFQLQLQKSAHIWEGHQHFQTVKNQCPAFQEVFPFSLSCTCTPNLFQECQLASQKSEFTPKHQDLQTNLRLLPNFSESAKVKKRISKHVLQITRTSSMCSKTKISGDNLRDSSATHHCLLYPLQCLCGTVSAKRVSLSQGSKFGAVSPSSRH